MRVTREHNVASLRRVRVTWWSCAIFLSPLTRVWTPSIYTLEDGARLFVPNRGDRREHSHREKEQEAEEPNEQDQSEEVVVTGDAASSSSAAAAAQLQQQKPLRWFEDDAKVAQYADEYARGARRTVYGPASDPYAHIRLVDHSDLGEMFYEPTQVGVEIYGVRDAQHPDNEVDERFLSFDVVDACGQEFQFFICGFGPYAGEHPRGIPIRLRSGVTYTEIVGRYHRKMGCTDKDEEISVCEISRLEPDLAQYQPWKTLAELQADVDSQKCGSVVDPYREVRQRIREAKTALRSQGMPYLPTRSSRARAAQWRKLIADGRHHLLVSAWHGQRNHTESDDDEQDDEPEKEQEIDSESDEADPDGTRVVGRLTKEEYEESLAPADLQGRPRGYSDDGLDPMVRLNLADIALAVAPESEKAELRRQVELLEREYDWSHEIEKRSPPRRELKLACAALQLVKAQVEARTPQQQAAVLELELRCQAAFQLLHHRNRRDGF